MSSFYHLCFVVQDLDRATADLTRALGMVWSPARDGKLGPWDYRIVFSVEGPPFFEVIEGPLGSPWDASAGSRFDHLGYWSDDVAADKQRLAERGAPLEFDSCPYGRSFTYHRLDSLGIRLELVDHAVQPDFLATWKPGAAPMPAIDLGNDSTGRDA
ncbi:VOC family protein [Brevibacterium sandarakinum]|uniref:VOC family protein n=1 Tax=Brevibacterium sandarakinum TaxID=629680 RepID=UPI000B8831A3|nr:VOC family protein [Brevibacterium sandarakinum]